MKNTLMTTLLTSMIFVILVLLSVAFLTLLERKKLASIQNSKGPNKVGFWGMMQPVVDGIKLILKETVFPINSLFGVFILSPMLAFSFGFMSWCLLPLVGFSFILCDIEYSFIIIFIFSIFHVYSIMLAGWASNSKYSMLGSLSSAAQLMAYDMSIGFIILTMFMATKTFNLHKMVEFQMNNGWLMWYYPILFVIFFMCCLAETNRHPFDLPEAEAELVSGYNVEYSSMGFALFFLGEYASMLLMSTLINLLFLGGWDYFFVFSNIYLDYALKVFFYFSKLLVIIYLFMSMSAAMPSYSYDQLMLIGWKILLPITFAMFVLNCIIFYFCDLLNYVNLILL